MFKFLKDKLKSTISKISEQFSKEGEDVEAEKIEETIEEKEVLEEKPKKAEIEKFEKEKAKQEGIIKKESEEKIEKIQKPKRKPEEIIEQPKEEEHKKRFFGLFKKKEAKEAEEEKKEEHVEEAKEEKPLEVEKPTEPEKKGIFKTITEKVVTKKINEKQFEKFFWDLEVTLLENNVAVEVIEKIKANLQQEIVEKPIKRTKIEDTIKSILQDSLKGLFDVEKIDLLAKVKEKKPYVICFVGINGSGKTTTIAKIAHMFKNSGLSCVLVASDTWRQAAIEQLGQWAQKLNVPIIKHSYGSDPAAVAYDGVAMAKARNQDVVLIDTAGRMHSNTNLMDEMKKIIRVAQPDMKIFIGESITGNDCVEQAKKFDEAIGIDGIILSKADIDEKGGAAISVSYVVKKPIMYIGTGQELTDLREFNPDIVVQGLGLEA